MSQTIHRLTADGLKMRQEVKNKTAGYLTAALGLVAGLAWNEAIKSLIDYILPINAGGLLAKFIYAIIITIVVVLVSYFLVGQLEKE